MSFVSTPHFFSVGSASRTSRTSSWAFFARFAFLPLTSMFESASLNCARSVAMTFLLCFRWWSDDLLDRRATGARSDIHDGNVMRFCRRPVTIRAVLPLVDAKPKRVETPAEQDGDRVRT